MLGRKKRTVWRYVKKGLLPRPVRLPSGTFWLLRDIDEFIEKAREGRP
jgi:predicted DNA-binding transcriptional regulator AlpA